MSHTHAAVLTPPGTGAIGLIRVAGPNAGEIVASFCRPATAHHSPNVDPAVTDSTKIKSTNIDSAKLKFVSIWDGDERVDEVVLAFPECDAGSMWGGDCVWGMGSVVDICPHGGVGVMRRILRLLVSQGVVVDAPDSAESPCATGRPPRGAGLTAGFSPRDQTNTWVVRNRAPSVGPGQAPAISACFETTSSRIRSEATVLMSVAKTPATVKFLAWQRQHLPPAVLEIARLAESDVQDAVTRLRKLQAGYDSARVRIEGATVAIVGPPNAGKSTLLNRLAGRDVAVVSEVGGTTRDWVDQLIDLAGVPITVIDTAGRRPDTDELQRRAIDAGCRMAKNADVTVLLLDGSIDFHGQRAQVEQVLSEVPKRGYRTVIAVNKRDKRAAWDPAKELGSFGRDLPVCTVSARSGEGVEILTERILESCGVIGCDALVPTFFTPRQMTVAQTLEWVLRTDASAAAGTIRLQMY